MLHQLSFCFAMNFIRTLFGIVLISFHVQKISAKWNLALRNTSYGPLAVLEEVGDPTLEIAIPQKYGERRSVAAYYSNDDDESEKEEVKSNENEEPEKNKMKNNEDDEPEEEKVTNNKDDEPPKKTVKKFRTACPSYTPEQKKIEAKWRQKVNAPISRLFFLTKYTGEEMMCPKSYNIDPPPTPSIKKTKYKCANSQGDIYVVGYPVCKSNEEDVDLVITYEMCYSENKEIGVIYTKHGLYSPGLMLLKVHDHYAPTTHFISPLDSKLKYDEKYYEKEYVYQFVPRYDMPTVLWENTTLFLFNYTPIGTSYKIFEGMAKYDNAIRFFNKQTGKPLTIFSGTFQTEIDPIGHFKSWRHKVLINYFWRVIFNHEKKASILVTQHTEKVCGEITPFALCDIKDKHFKIIQKYNKGGCTYRCSVNHELLLKLNLEVRTISGILDINYTPKPVPKTPPKEATGGESETGVQSSPQAVSIDNFADAATFSLAVVIVDAVAAQAMIAEGAMADVAHADGGNEGGTHHDGTDNDGPGEGGADGA